MSISPTNLAMSSLMDSISDASPNPVMMMLTPPAARKCAQARPIPLVDPVTRATFFAAEAVFCASLMLHSESRTDSNKELLKVLMIKRLTVEC